MECIGVGFITTTTQIILDNKRCTTLLVLVISVIQSRHFFWSDTRACCWRSDLVMVVLLIETSSTYSSFDVLKRTQYRTPVGSLENAVLCCTLFTEPYHSNDGAVLLRVCVVMAMLLHSNGHLQISTVASRLSMFATCGRIPWQAPTLHYYSSNTVHVSNFWTSFLSTLYNNINLLYFVCHACFHFLLVITRRLYKAVPYMSNGGLMHMPICLVGECGLVAPTLWR
jgi:hypothetical protein